MCLLCPPHRLAVQIIHEFSDFENKAHRLWSHSVSRLSATCNNVAEMYGSSIFNQVLPAFVLKWAIFSLRIASFIKCIPFELLQKREERRLLLRKITSKPKLHTWFFVSLINIGYTIFQCISFARNLKQYGFDTDTAIQTILLMRSMLAVLFFMNNLFKGNGIVWEVNQLSFILGLHGQICCNY